MEGRFRERMGWRLACLVATIAVIVGVTSSLAVARPSSIGWQSRACEQEASARASSPSCTPPAHVPQPPRTPVTCVGAVVCMGTYADLKRAGFDIGGMRAADRTMLAAHPELFRPADDMPDATTTYSAWVDFYLYLNTNCSGTVKQNNRCGWLYHKYIKIVDGIPKAGTTVTSYPARSGNNNPADEWVQNVGPLPDDYTYKWGFMNGAFTGYEADTDPTFDPGKWRLDPWSVTKSGVTRGAFEIHGGTSDHDFWQTGTKGCIRLPSSSITGLKSMWNGYTSNKKTGASVYIHY